MSLTHAEVARAAGLEFHGSSGEVAVSCPWHEDRHPSASLSLDKGVLFCHACNRGSRVDRLDSTPDYLRNVAVACGALAGMSCLVFTFGLIVGNRWFDEIRVGADWQNLYGIVYYAAGNPVSLLVQPFT